MNVVTSARFAGPVDHARPVARADRAAWREPDGRPFAVERRRAPRPALPAAVPAAAPVEPEEYERWDGLA
jgi:hypothetical protein